MRIPTIALLLAPMLLGTAAPADAEIVKRATEGFIIRHEGMARGTPAQTWAALVDWGGWWPGQHSYSGDAANIELEVEADGELEEVWAGGEVLHGSVLAALPDRMLRLSAPLGPLQALPVNTVLEFTLSPSGTGTRVGMVFHVAGPAAVNAGRYADSVDKVFAEAFPRLLAHTARPKPAPDKKTKE
jgi:uncharacterized protein YndB with AHSA1/START domain